MDRDKLGIVLRSGKPVIEALEVECAEEKVNNWVSYLLEACDMTMPLELGEINGGGGRDA